jgi:hypothetical protein
MANIKGTAGKDIYTVKSGDNYDALEGDDELTFEKGGTAQGGLAMTRSRCLLDFQNGTQRFGIGLPIHLFTLI